MTGSSGKAYQEGFKDGERAGRLAAKNQLDLLTKEVYQSVIEFEEAAKLLRTHYPGVASLYDNSAARAKEVLARCEQ